MSTRVSRRALLSAASTGGAILGLGKLSFFSKLPLVAAADAATGRIAARLRPEIEPLVRLLEDTSRERLLEEIAGRIRRGLSYKSSVAALEDCHHVSAFWRDRYSAATMLQLRGSGDPDSHLIRRVRALLQG